jgi:hypothetical protein
MNRVIQTDIHSVISARVASANTSITAGGAGDNTAITGSSIDRAQFGAPPLCADLLLQFDATLAQAATLTLKTVKVQDSADGSTWADYVTFTDPGVVATGPTGGGNVTGVTRLGVNLSSARRYVRAVFTPDLSAGGTDTAKLLAAFVFAGFDAIPSPA